MRPKGADRIGAVWSGSILFAQTCLSENLGTLRYNVLLVTGLGIQWASFVREPFHFLKDFGQMLWELP